jgi:hypothetical protein
MTYKEMHNLINEFGLQEDGRNLSFKNYTVANIYNNLIDNKTKEIAYRLDFICSYISTMNYEVAKKAAAKRIAIIKDVIVANKRIEIERDFV